jgi:hypothetical protein
MLFIIMTAKRPGCGSYRFSPVKLLTAMFLMGKLPGCTGRAYNSKLFKKILLKKNLEMF